MKISINIAEDTELRAFVKEQIRGAVKAITREEILGYIVAEISKKDRTTNDVFVTELRAAVKLKVAGTGWSPGLVEQIVREETRTALREKLSKL